MNYTKIKSFNTAECSNVVTQFKPALKDKFGKILEFDYKKIYNFDDDLHHRGTPRYSTVVSVIPCASFYYLNFLLELNPAQIVDLGCGMNFFKDIIPNIHGIDPSDDAADEHDMFDEDFANGHKSQYQCVFSIDALHYIPISDFSSRVCSFKKIIQKNGRGYVSMNSARLIDHTPDDVLLRLFGTTAPTPTQIEFYIKQEIESLDFNFLAVDVLITEKPDEYIDGNIRLVFEV